MAIIINYEEAKQVIKNKPAAPVPELPLALPPPPGSMEAGPQRVFDRLQEILSEENCSMHIYAVMEHLGGDNYRAVAHVDIKVKP